ncbi:Protein kibra [Orchesella cincta]|uniref:Protein kibra n=1 Tax=Orchesella cincta TaxID=48709 RepID=A0A1D2NDC8_ORCCI|nr:Protein kibra [Orchesella cincta]
MSAPMLARGNQVFKSVERASEAAKLPGDSKTMTTLLEDERIQQLFQLPTAIDPHGPKGKEAQKMLKLLKKTSREIYKLRKSKTPRGQPDMISFKEKITFFTHNPVAMSAFAKDSDNVEREESASQQASSSTSVPYSSCDPNGSGTIILEEEEEEDEDEGEEEVSSSVEEPSTSSSSSTRPSFFPHPGQSSSIKSINPAGPSCINKFPSSSPTVKPRISKSAASYSSTSSQTNEASPSPCSSDSNKETESQCSVATHCSDNSNLVPSAVASVSSPASSTSCPVSSSRSHQNSGPAFAHPGGNHVDVNRDSSKLSKVVAGAASSSAPVAEPGSSSTESNVHTAKIDKKLPSKESNSNPHIEYVVLI